MGNKVDLAEIYGTGSTGFQTNADDVLRLSVWTEWMTGDVIGVEYQTTAVEDPYWVGTGSREQFSKGKERGGRHERAFVYFGHAGMAYAERAGIAVPAWIERKIEAATSRLDKFDGIELADRGATRGEDVFKSRYCWKHGGMVDNPTGRETCGGCFPLDGVSTVSKGG